MTTTPLAIDQRGIFKGRWRFELDDQGCVRVSSKTARGRHNYTEELRNISPKTMRAEKTAWAAWVFGWVLLAAWIFSVVGTIVGLAPDPWSGRLIAAGFISIIFAPFVLGLFQKAARESYDVTLFYNRWSGQVALSVANRSPDPQTAADFISKLTTHIEQAAPFEARGEGLADQVEKLNEMHTRGLLSAAEFTAAKQRLLGTGQPEKSIGFH